MRGWLRSSESSGPFAPFFLLSCLPPACLASQEEDSTTSRRKWLHTINVIDELSVVLKKKGKKLKKKKGGGGQCCSQPTQDEIEIHCPTMSAIVEYLRPEIGDKTIMYTRGLFFKQEKYDFCLEHMITHFHCENWPCIRAWLKNYQPTIFWIQDSDSSVGWMSLSSCNSTSESE